MEFLRWKVEVSEVYPPDLMIYPPELTFYPLNFSVYPPELAFIRQPQKKPETV
jgi:hypothetical protein